ncbi:MAG: DUF2442 domain-containing protein [Candidatus Binatia bacterium]
MISVKLKVTNVSSHGIWLIAHGQELFMPYEEFPWFKDAPIGKIFKVEELTSGHFYWPELDIDLTMKIIEHPERFPLKAKTQAKNDEKERNGRKRLQV